MTVARRQQISVFDLSSVVDNLQSQLAANSQAAALQLSLQLGAANTEISALREQ